MNVKEHQEGYNVLAKCPQPVGYKSLVQQEKTLQNQGGGGSGSQSTTKTTLSQTQKNALLAKQKSHAMSIAMRPGQQVMMNAFMMYMSGKQLNIFSISITSTAILTPLTSLFNIDNTFGQMGQKVDISTAKLVYVLLNLVWLGIGLYKMSSMRLLPTTSADWTYKLQWKDMLEVTSIPPDNVIA